MKYLWIPNVFIYNLDTFDAMFSLQKLSGLWIIEKQDLFYNQVRNSILHLFPSDYSSKYAMKRSQYTIKYYCFSTK